MKKAHEMHRRVIDKRAGDYGTAVADLGRGFYRVHWDDPTPYQDEVRARIPSADFDWAEADDEKRWGGHRKGPPRVIATR